MCTVSADEIHLKVEAIRSSDSSRTLAPKPANPRVEKLRVSFEGEQLADVDFRKMFTEIRACLPNLKVLELRHEKSFLERPWIPYAYAHFVDAVDSFISKALSALEVPTPFKVFVKSYFGFHQYSVEVRVMYVTKPIWRS